VAPEQEKSDAHHFDETTHSQRAVLNIRNHSGNTN
jgi:hypothetical protein